MKSVLEALKGLLESKQFLTSAGGFVADVLASSFGHPVPDAILAAPGLGMGLRTWGKEVGSGSSLWGSKQLWSFLLFGAADFVRASVDPGHTPGVWSVLPGLGMGMRTFGKEKK